MICSIKKLITIGSGILFSVFFSVLSYSYSYAISDKTITYQPNTLTSGTFIFDDCKSASCLSQYNYLKIEVDTSSLSTLNDWRFTIYLTSFYSVNGSGRDSSISLSNFNSFSIIALNTQFLNPYQDSLKWGSSANVAPITFTLMENFQSCPDPDPCPVVPEHPYDDKFDQIIKAIYVCAGTVLVIYFFYCIYRIIIKNSGVK